MKFISAEQELEIPEGVEVEVKARNVVVKGKLGTLKQSFRHIPIEIFKGKSKSNKNALRFRMWLQKKKRNAAIGSIRSTIRNMVTGVTVGYKFKMVLAYSHFPIVVNVIENGRVHIPLCRQLKSKTFWASKWTRESMPPRESSSLRKKKKRTTWLSKESTFKMFLKFAPESNSQPSSKIKIFVPSLTESTFRMQDWSLLIETSI